MAEEMISVVDASIRLGQPYRSTYDDALRGRFGPVERRGSRLFVRSSVVERLATKSEWGLADVPERFADLNPPVARYHRLRIEAEAILRSLVADGLEAESRDDLERAEIILGLVTMLREARYEWDARAGRWRLEVPGHPSHLSKNPATVPTPAEHTSRVPA